MSPRLRWAGALGILFVVAAVGHSWIAACHGEQSFDSAVAVGYLRLALSGWGPSGLVGASAFGDHFNPLFLTALPVFLVSPSVLAIQLFKAAVYVSSLAGIGLLARRRLGPGTAGWAATLTAAGPMFWISLFADYHTETLAAGLIPWLLLAYDSRRLGWCLLLGLLIALGKENLPLVVGGLGVLALHERRTPRWWLSLGGLGAAVFVLGVFVVIPQVAPPEGNITAVRFGRLASLAGLGQALGDGSLYRWLGFLILSCGGLCLLAPRTLWPLVPLLLQHGLSAWAPEREIDFHYLAPILPLLAASAIAGCSRVPARRRKAVVVVLLIINGLAHVGLAFVEAGPAARLTRMQRQHGAAELAARIPQDAPAWASVSTAARLANRERLYLVESLATGCYSGRTWQIDGNAELRRAPPRHGLIDVRDSYMRNRYVEIPSDLAPLDAVGDLVLIGEPPVGLPPLVELVQGVDTTGWPGTGGVRIRAGEGGRYRLRLDEAGGPGIVQLKLTTPAGKVIERRAHRLAFGLARGAGVWEVRYAPPARHAGAGGPQRLYVRLYINTGWLLLSSWD